VSYLLEAVLELRRRRSAAAFASTQLVTLVVVTVAVGIALAGTTAFAVSGSGDMGPPYFRPLGDKVLAVASPFLSFSNGQLAVMLAGFLLALAGLLYRHRPADLVTPLALCGPAFLIIYFLSPRYIIGAGDVDVRWLPAAYLLPFCMATTARPPGPGVLKALFAICVVHALVVFAWARRIDRDLDDYDAVIAILPPEAPVLPLSTDGGRFGRVRPYEYYGLWHTIRGGGQVPGLFSGTGMRRDGPPMHHFDHIRVLYQRYQPPPGWGERNWEPLDCAAIRHDYTYVIQAGADARVGAMIRSCAREERRIGRVTLYRVSPSDVSGGRAPEKITGVPSIGHPVSNFRRARPVAASRATSNEPSP
jgi:hypothetical protein